MFRRAVHHHCRAAVVISAAPSPFTVAPTTYLLIVVFTSLRARQGGRKLNERCGVGINREVVKSLTYMLRRAAAISSAVPSPAVAAAYL